MKSQQPQGGRRLTVPGAAGAARTKSSLVETPPHQPFVRKDCDERMDAIIRTQFVGPASFGRSSPQAGSTDFSYLRFKPPWRVPIDRRELPV
jgi:hypothetical protein